MVEASSAAVASSWASVLLPRLIAADADLSHVHRVEVFDGDGRQLLTLPDDVPAIAEKCAELRADGHPVGFVVIDPVSVFLLAWTLGGCWQSLINLCDGARAGEAGEAPSGRHQRIGRSMRRRGR